MDFAIYNDADSDSTVISNRFIDDYMRDANDAQIKIYLYLVRMMSAHRGASISEMADQFNHTEKEVLRSLRYWEKQGLLSLEYDRGRNLIGIHLCELRPQRPTRSSDNRVISITPMLSAVQPQTTKESAETPVPQVPARTAASEEQLRAFRESKTRAPLLFIIEQYVGKPLSVTEVRTVYYIAEELRFSDDLIDYLFQYCLGLGKKDFRYIEKVAVNWAQNGVTTPKQAEHAIAAGSKSTGRSRMPRSTRNAFTQFEQHQYDFDELEKQILDN